MPALDTNVLVRYLVRDDDGQRVAAERLIRRCVQEGRRLLVPVTVALELEWVLRASFRYAKPGVIAAFSDLLSAVEMDFESERAIDMALHFYRTGSADFAGCLHVALAAQAGELPLWTFDKAASRIAGAQAVGR